MTPDRGPLATRLNRRTVLAGSAAAAGAALLPGVAGRQALRAAFAQDGGSVTVGTIGDFLNLDPFNMSYVNYPIMENVYDQLVRLDHEIVPQPWLAESWELSDDYLTLVLNLRSGVKFHSGREMTSDDVVANFARAGVAETGGNIYPNMGSIAEVNAVDPLTVEVLFSQPAAYVYSALGLLSVIDPETFDSLSSVAGGTGAFRLEEWAPGDRAVLVKNPDYWDTSRPLVDSATIMFYSDEGSLVSALEGGLLDIAISVPAREAERLGQSFTIQPGQPGARFYFLGLSAKNAPFDNKLVRQAMSYALDRQTLVNNVLFGVAEPIVTMFPEGSPAFFEDHAEMYPFDLDQAKALLEEAGFPDGIEFTIPTPSGFPEMAQFAQIFQADLARIGSTVTIEPMDNAQWYPILREGSYDGTFSFAGGPQLYPTRIALSGNMAATNNVAWPDGNPPAAFAEGLMAADATFDPAEQEVALRQMTDSLMDEAWVLPIAFKPDLFAYADTISGLDWGVYSQIRLDQVQKNG